MIKDFLISELKKRFPTRRFKEGSSPNPIATFPAAHPEVGDVMIYEDGEELMVDIAKVSHGHFGRYESSLSTNQREDLVIQDVINFLEELFSDKILLWVSETGAGGWTHIKNSNDLKRKSEWKGLQNLIDSGLEVLKEDGRYFLWSGPVNII